MSRSRGYVFTINNWTEEDVSQVALLAEKASYVIAAKEVGKEGTPHIQGYVYFATLKTTKQVSVIIKRAYISPQKGTFDQAIDYCKKAGEFIEVGDRPKSNKRKGEMGAEYWQEQLSLAKRGKIDECDPKLQLTHMGSLLKVVSYYAPMPDDLESCDNHWYYGPTGTGKSYTARNENPGHYLKMCNKWWDGYQQEEVVIIEDFDKRHGDHLGHHLKIWLDRYAFPAEIKGAKVNLRPKKIIVTSNYHPTDIWNDAPTLEPIMRRIHVKCFAGSINDTL